MIRVSCFTNLDLRGEIWPTELPALPQVGQLIQSKTLHQGRYRLELEVVRITWKYYARDDSWSPQIELHMAPAHRGLLSTTNPKAEQGSIWAFYDWYAPIVGTTVHAFL